MNIFKFILLVLIFIFCSFVGYVLGERFKNRHNQIREIIKLITLLQNEVIYNFTTLPEAFFIIGRKGKEPFNKICEKIGDRLLSPYSKGMYLSAKECYEEEKVNLYLNDEDLIVLSDFFKTLGDLGVYGQEKIFKLTMENLNINCKEAEENSKKNTKAYRYIGVILGAMFIIFLIWGGRFYARLYTYI